MKKTKSDLPVDSTSRRSLLKALGGGTLAGGVLLPNHWTKPVVDTVLMPVHAQTSPQQDDGGNGGPSSRPCDCDCSFRVALFWATNSGTEEDFDLELQTEGGTRIAPKGMNGRLRGNCLAHQGDSTAQASGDFTSSALEEIIPINSGMIRSGTYQIFVRNATTNGGSYTLTARACGSSTVMCNGGMPDRETVIGVGQIRIPACGEVSISLSCPSF